MRVLAAVLAAALPTPAVAQPAAPAGADVYARACAACHGPVGRGQPASVVGFDVPLPDFSDCNFAVREPDADWLAVMHEGGPVRAFDRLMPAFGGALGEAELEAALAHVRTFCAEPAWPAGELNLPRALATEKAYPEDEAVWTITAAAEGDGAITNELLYEKRFRARNQVEFKLPIASHARSGGSWEGGVGDLALAVKRVLHHRKTPGTIVSVAGEVVLPTGDAARGLGKGVTVFEPFVAFGQLLPADGFVQAQAGFELPADGDKASREAFWRVAAGRTFTEGRFGRAWSPMVELLAARELESGAGIDWDLLPQVQVTLNRRQHVMLNGGVRVPLTDRGPRRTSVMVYVLWDWFDGGLFDGW